MLQGLYSSATALDAATKTHEIVAHNLAHMNVPGFRRTVPVFQTFEMSLPDSSGNTSRLGTHIEELHTDHEPGPLQTTGRPLDLALKGDGFFVLEPEDGPPLYTRNGVFQLNEQGRLVTSSGVAVRGVMGPLVLPPETTPSELRVSMDGSIWIRGGNQGDPEVLAGKLDLVTFPDPHQLVAAGTTTFSAPAEAFGLPSVAEVVQGSREGSNVSAVNELVQLLSQSRYFEASQRAMRAIADAVGHNTNPNS
jgi:flagellar basal-body rod protein FlgF